MTFTRVERIGSIIMTHQIFESKLWKSIIAVASGIMTSLLYDLVSHTSYALQKDGEQYILTPCDSNIKSTIFAAVCIFVLFFFIWGTFTLIIQIGAKASKQLTFKKMEHISGSKLARDFITIKEHAISLETIFSDKSDIVIVKLQLRELASIIASLHANFYQHNQHRKVHMKDFFRHPNHSTIININNTISKYEFLALIELLDRMVINASSQTNNDILMENDCKEMKQMLDDLKIVIE